MQIAKLTADLSFLSLHLPEVLAGDDLAGIDWGLFAKRGAIGSDWIPRQVVYFENDSKPSVECCEANLALDESPKSPDAMTKIGDFPHFWAINQGVFNDRSFAAFQELIRPFVEFLPLKSKSGNFVAFKVLHFVDALNHQESVIEWQPQLKKDLGNPRVARQIKKAVFYDELLTHEVIFQIPEMPLHTNIFVTERFMEVVKQHQLSGFQFSPVCPIAPDSRAKFAQKRMKRLK